jgi:hypothetical protein
MYHLATLIQNIRTFLLIAPLIVYFPLALEQVCWLANKRGFGPIKSIASKRGPLLMNQELIRKIDGITFALTVGT